MFSGDPDLPDVLYGMHLINYLRLFSEVSYTEIESWCRQTDNDLPGWEREAMVVLSGKYQAMRSQATKPIFPAPYVGSIEAVNAGVDAQFEAMMVMSRHRG